MLCENYHIDITVTSHLLWCKTKRMWVVFGSVFYYICRLGKTQHTARVDDVAVEHEVGRHHGELGKGVGGEVVLNDELPVLRKGSSLVVITLKINHEHYY